MPTPKEPAMTRRIVLATLCCTLALADVARAQPPQSDAQRTRSLFLATIAAMVAQGVGTGLAQGLRGTITQWFQAKPQPPRAPEPTPAAEPPRTAEATHAAQPAHEPAVQPQAGVAYEVHALAADGSARAVDPASHVFRTGDRFQVHYRPSLPGQVRVVNTDPRGRESGIDEVRVAAGELATLGPYRFEDGPGRETLTLRLQPCSTAAMAASTRRIVKAEGARPATAPVRLAACGDAASPGSRARTIAKVATDGRTRFALEPLSAQELRSGVAQPRQVQIVLRHG
jgi:hypothetical protein